MKGIIFNLLEEVVRQDYGDDGWDEVLEQAGVEGAYTSLGSYPDAELIALVGAAASRYGHTPTTMLRVVGRRAMPVLAAKYPEFFRGHTGTRSFVLTLNGIIHPEVRKLYPGARTPDFEFDTTRPDVLGIVYESPRRLCAFAEGLIEGAADHYGEQVALTQPQCMHRGDPACRIEVRFSPV